MTQENEDIYRAAYADDEDLVPFDVRDYSDRRGMRILLGLIALLLLAVAVLFKMYYSGTRDRNAPIEISTENTPFKVAPENPGGEVTPNQDMAVYDAMKGQSDTDTPVNATLPEEPVAMPDRATIVTNDASGANRHSEADIPAPQPAVPEPVRTEPAVKEQPRAQIQAPQAGGSDYVVQVASLRSEPEARSTWYALKEKFAAELPNGSFADVRRVDLNEKGIYYRLRIAGLSDKASASSLCTRFKAQGQACFVTRK